MPPLLVLDCVWLRCECKQCEATRMPRVVSSTKRNRKPSAYDVNSGSDGLGTDVLLDLVSAFDWWQGDHEQRTDY